MALFEWEDRGTADLGWLANFEANHLPLIRIVLFDGVE